MPGVQASSSAGDPTNGPHAGQQDVQMMRAAAFNHMGPPAMLQPCLWVRPQPAPVGTLLAPTATLLLRLCRKSALPARRQVLKLLAWRACSQRHVAPECRAACW